MSLKYSVTSVFILVLILQLATVRVDFVIPSLSYGYFAEKPIQKVRNLLSVSPQSVRYVSAEQTSDSLIFVGDVLLARNVEFLMSQHGNQYPYQGMDFTMFGLQPYVFGNFEAAIPQNHVPTPIKMIDFSVDSKYLPAMRKAGFTHVSLANNHSLDFGEGEFSYTVSQLETNGIKTVGHQRDLSRESVEFVEVGGVMVAIVAIHTLHKLPTYSELKEVFSYASSRSEFQIVYVHWGTEYKSTHNSRQRDAAERFVDAGADLIVGHHPHVVQDIELINDVPVFYSLGNYIFDQYDSSDTEQGLLLHLDFSELRSISLVPVSSENNLSQPAPMDEADHARFLQLLAKRSAPDVQDFILSGFFPLNVTVASSSKMAMMSR